MVAYLGYTLRMRTLFRGWPIMVNDTHTRRRRLNLLSCLDEWILFDNHVNFNSFEQLQAYNQRRKCCPWERGRGVAHSFNCTICLMANMHLAYTLVIILFSHLMLGFEVGWMRQWRTGKGQPNWTNCWRLSAKCSSDGGMSMYLRWTHLHLVQRKHSKPLVHCWWCCHTTL